VTVLTSFSAASSYPSAVLRAALAERCDAVLPVDYADMEVLAEHGDLFERAGVALAAPPAGSVKLAADKSRLPELLAGVASAPKQVVFGGSADRGSRRR
jgi:hypothetical protein